MPEKLSDIKKNWLTLYKEMNLHAKYIWGHLIQKLSM